MTIAAQAVLQRVVETLSDPTSVRWPIGELARYFNDGQREIAMYRPDAAVKNAALLCVAGAKQTLPTNGSKLLDIVRNTAGRSIRMIDRKMLDLQVPNWHALTGVSEVQHFTYDPRDPLVFYVYPPASAGVSLNIVYSAYPTAVTEPASGTYGAISGNVDLPDIYANTLGDYILYRAYSKDSEFAGNGQRAAAHYAAFSNAIGVEMRATLGVMPTSSGTGNAVA